MINLNNQFYFLDGENLVRVISKNGDKSVICFANMDVPDTILVDNDRLFKYKNENSISNDCDLIVYIAGPVSSKGYEIAFNDFKKTHNYLIENYNFKYIYNVFDIIDISKDKTWEEYMVETYKILLKCNSIYLQSGWENSKGATIEHSIAKILGYKIFFEL